MLDFNPDSRITAEEALTHRFFAPILRNIETFAKTGDEQVGVTPTKDKPIRKSGDTKTRGKEVSSKVFEVPNHLPMPKQWAISEYIDTLDKVKSANLTRLHKCLTLSLCPWKGGTFLRKHNKFQTKACLGGQRFVNGHTDSRAPHSEKIKILLSTRNRFARSCG